VLQRRRPSGRAGAPETPESLTGAPVTDLAQSPAGSAVAGKGAALEKEANLSSRTRKAVAPMARAKEARRPGGRAWAEERLHKERYNYQGGGRRRRIERR
jgi:hypothetical protein